MTPTNDTPVTVEQCDREVLADEYAIVGDNLNANRIRHGHYVCEEACLALSALARYRLAALASAPAGDGVDMAKYADMSIDEKANAMADDCVGDGWELVGYFREKARQAQANADSARDAATRLALARPRAAVGERERAAMRTIYNTAINPCRTKADMEAALSMIASIAEKHLALQSPPAKVEGRRAALARMVAIDEELGLYDDPKPESEQ